jgi:hypothetical protein
MKFESFLKSLYTYSRFRKFSGGLFDLFCIFSVVSLVHFLSPNELELQ